MIGIRLLQLRIALMAAVLIATFSAAKFAVGKPLNLYGRTPGAFTPPNTVTITTTLVGEARTVFQKVNAERKARKLKPLVWDEDLSKIAKDYSRQMAEEKFFDHYDPQGLSVVDRAESNKIYNWKKIGENLFQCEGYDEPAETAVKGWMNSKTHRRNIVDSEWTHTGVGVYETEDGVSYFTQVFMTK